MNIRLWCDRIITWSFSLLFILVPLILTPINYELFEFNKMIVTYMIAGIIAGAWAIKIISEREIKIAKTPLDIPIVLFVGSVLVSSLFSMDPHVSWFGYYSRFNGGMWSVITYVFLYYAFVTHIVIRDMRYAIRYCKIAISTAVIISIYAVLERLGIDKKIWVQDVQNRVFSTLGQPNWLAAYLVALIPLTFSFANTFQNSNDKVQIPASPAGRKFKVQNVPVLFWVWNVISILFFTVLLFTRSRSGLAGFAVADVVFWGIYILKQKRFPFSFYLFHGVCTLIIFFNGISIAQLDSWTLHGIQERITKPTIQTTAKPATQTGPALETGGTESGTIRKYVWQAAITTWRSSTKTWFIGTGTETFAFAFYKFRPPAHNLTSEWDFLYNKAHNEYLNYLATTGILGLGTYLLFLGVFILWFVKNQISNLKFQNNAKVQNEQEILKLALFAGWISILVTNFFGFSVVIMQIFLFLFPAMMIISTKQYEKKLTNSNETTGKLIISVLTILVLGIILSRWYADTLFAKSYQLARSGQYALAKTLIDKAVTLFPTEPVYHDERSTTLAALAVGALDQQQATIGGTLAQQALAENDRAITISPANVNFWKTRTKIYYSFSVYDPKFTPAAIEALTHAQALSPNDPKILYNLAILSGRTAENDAAVKYLKRAIELKSNYRDAYYALYIFYQELKDSTAARQILEQYVQTVDASDAQFIELLGKEAQ